MRIRQFVIQLCVEQTGKAHDGTQHTYQRCIEVDLARDNIAEFLDKIPDTLNDHSYISVAIAKNDGEIISYIDGMTHLSEGFGWGPMQRISVISDDFAEDLRAQAKVETEIRYIREHGPSIERRYAREDNCNVDSEYNSSR
jgi:hypothetical protein